MTRKPEQPKTLEELADRRQPSIAVEFYHFLRENKKWWLLPILLMIGLFAILFVLASTGAAPFIYTMF